MKRNILYIFSFMMLAFISLTSCENFRDNNGDLGGQWQLTEWREIDDAGQTVSIKATNANGIYYGFHRETLQLLHSTIEQDGYHHRHYATFEHTPNQLNILHIEDNFEKPCNYTDAEIAELGIPADGKFHIDALDADNMILSYPHNVLRFRKY